jgi:hypothetical protein
MTKDKNQNQERKSNITLKDLLDVIPIHYYTPTKEEEAQKEAETETELIKQATSTFNNKLNQYIENIIWESN